MDEDLEMGDMGVMDAMGLSLDIPEPTIENPDGVSSDLLGPGGFQATIADLGLSSHIPSISAPVGLASGFGGQLGTPEGEAGMLPALPAIDLPPSPEPPPAFSAESPDSIQRFPSALPGEASFADPLSVQDGFSSALLGLPGIAPPPATDSPFLGAGTPPDELLDLQMAMTPPPPAQEGFAGASDAQLAPPAPRSHLDSAPGSPGLSLSAMQAITSDLWGGPTASSPGVSHAGSAGTAIHIENLHLPATSSNEMLDQLLAQAPDLSNADLRELA